MPTTSDAARDSLDGLSVGDALGAQFFVPGRSVADLLAGRPPAPPWEWTDDTEMACSVYTHLRDHGRIDRDRLAATFADRCEPYRGYSGNTVALLHEIRDGRPWAEAAGALFDGRGSWGNGAAMRVAPLGAHFAGDLDRAAAQAALSAEVTHRHPEAIIAAIAVAVAAAHAAATRGRSCAPEELLSIVEPYLVDGRTAAGIRRARRLLGRSVAEAAYELGNGAQVSAQDTVPFTLWTAATFLDDYPAAVTACVEAGGDVDTTAAIVGGIVAAHTGTGTRFGVRGIPPHWLSAREPLPTWATDGDTSTRASEDVAPEGSPFTKPEPSTPLTYDEALRIARSQSKDSDTLAPYPHHRLENARYGRGFAFLHTIRTDRGDLDAYILVMTTTAHGGGLLSAAGRTIDTVIAEHLARAEHANRHIPDSELSIAHRMAIHAYDAGLTRIDELPLRATTDAETADYAEFLLIGLRRNGRPGGSGRNILARNDFLMESADAGRRYTQPCPHCARPAAYAPRYPRSVCDHCRDRTTDRAGRRITGFNTSFSGGMIAYYTDTLEYPDRAGSHKEECVEVTRTGACFIDGHPATMQEARFGGIVIQTAADVPPPAG